MLTILDTFVVLLVTLLPAQRAVLITHDCFSSQIFLCIANQSCVGELWGFLENVAESKQERVDESLEI